MFNSLGNWRRSSQDQWLTAWEKHRRMGFLGFVLVWGFGRFGLLGWLLFTLVMCGMMWLWDGLPALEGKAGKVLVLGSLSIPAGVLGSACLWFDTERKYERMMRETGREPTPPGTGDPDAG